MATATLAFHPLPNSLPFPHNSTKTHKPFSPAKLFLEETWVSSSAQSASATTSGDSYTTSPNEPSCSDSSSVVKAPTAPWMRGPLHVEPTEMLDLSKPRTKKGANFGEIKRNPDAALTGKMGPGRGKKEMKRVFGGIKKLEQNKSSEEISEIKENVRYKFPPGALWGGGNFDEELLTEKESSLAESDNGIEGILFDAEIGGFDGVSKKKIGGKMPWDIEEKFFAGKVKKEKVPTAAELTLDKELLYRLRREAETIKKWVKVMKAGVTQAVVDQIYLLWKNNELAMIKFDVPLSRNMDRALEIVEMKTGGLVVWKKKDTLVIYRGNKCRLDVHAYAKNGSVSLITNNNSTVRGSRKDIVNVAPDYLRQQNVPDTRKEMVGKEDTSKLNWSLYEKEADRLLDGLGPRFVDWWMQKPLPVDADLLPEIVPGFSPPLRLCPSHARSQLMNDELTYFRKLAKSLPTHFVLGRNRRLQGLAESILKLWEKCHIAKIAVKWGVQNTDNEQMANELKYLTGGVLLLRNKFFIILYRGKDFLPSEVAELVSTRELELRRCQLLEETVRLNAREELNFPETPLSKSSTTGTLSEFHDILKECANPDTENSEEQVKLEAEKKLVQKELRDQHHKFYILKKKVEKSAARLAELNSVWKPAEQDADQEMLTTEERECLRQIGLKMEAMVVLGRRGIFKGVIESLHQHWKHREIVKVITMQRFMTQVTFTAKSLESESGGVLVSIEKLKEGHAILLFRGKNYRRPKVLQRNLLSKKEALSRSLEMQRLGSLKFFANQREQTVSNLRLKLQDISKGRSNLVESS